MKPMIFILCLVLAFISCERIESNLSTENELKHFGILNIYGDTLESLILKDTLLIDVPFSFSISNELDWFADISENAFITPNPKKTKLNLQKHTELIITSESGIDNILKLSYKKAEAIKHVLISFSLSDMNDNKIKNTRNNENLTIIPKDSIQNNNNEGDLGSGSILPQNFSNGNHFKFYIIDTLPKNSSPEKSLPVGKNSDIKIEKPKYEEFKIQGGRSYISNIYKVYGEDNKISSEYISVIYIKP